MLKALVFEDRDQIHDDEVGGVGAWQTYCNNVLIAMVTSQF